MNKSLRPSYLPLLLVFVLTNALFIVFKKRLEAKGVDIDVLLVGNIILFLVSEISFLLTHRALQSSNPQAFVRAIYGSFMIKFFVVAIAAFVYIMLNKEKVNKPALGACGGLYIIYTWIEIRTLTKLLKQKKNA